MTTLFRNSLLVFFLFFSLRSAAQSTSDVESLGLPGDNLNLYAVMKIFQESATLEDFEKKLNEPDNRINNLDLDGDNRVDYISVHDDVENNVHSIALKVATNRHEMQNVAVFIVDNSNGQPQLQVVGDEDLYGEDYIIEPNYDNRNDRPDVTPNPGYTGSAPVYNTSPAQSQQVIVQREIITPAQIAIWPVIMDIYRPSYSAWRSPWSWGYYPSYWRAWQPYDFHYYYGYHYHWNYFYYGNYRRWYHYRNPWWYDRYYHQPGWRHRSNVYYTRYYRGDYRRTYDRPDMIRYGSADYRKRYPNSPGYTSTVPSVRVPDRRLPVAKPRPLPVNPGYRNDQAVNAPRERYRTTATGPSRATNTTPAPVSNPATPANRMPSTSRPATSSPVRQFPVADQPVTRPQAAQKPVVRPQVEERPVTRPQVYQRPVSRPQVDQRPVSRPQVEQRPVTRPQVEQRPVTRPQVDRTMTRPQVGQKPTTRPQVRQAPAARPVTTMRPSSSPAQRPFAPKAAPRQAPQRR